VIIKSRNASIHALSEHHTSAGKEAEPYLSVNKQMLLAVSNKPPSNPEGSSPIQAPGKYKRTIEYADPDEKQQAIAKILSKYNVKSLKYSMGGIEPPKRKIAPNKSINKL